MKNEDKAIEFLMSVKTEAIKAAFGICALPEKELFQRLEMLYMNGVDAGVKLGAERSRVVKPLVWRAVVENEWFKTTDRHYEVFAQQGGSGDFYARDIWRGDTVIDGGSLDEAKAACQKHHEQFVLSMLEPV